jgi:hypothetical protein
LTIVLQKWGISMRQRKPNLVNDNPSVADYLVQDLQNPLGVKEATNVEEHFYIEVASLVLGFKAYLLGETDFTKVAEELLKDVEKRRNLGLAKYGVELKPFNGRDTKRDLYEELLDAAFYAKCNVLEKKNGG